MSRTRASCQENGRKLKLVLYELEKGTCAEPRLFDVFSVKIRAEEQNLENRENGDALFFHASLDKNP